MNKQLDLLEALNKAKENGGTVTYHFEDETKQVTPINKEIFFNEKGKERDLTHVLETITSIQHDLGAISFEL